MKQQEKLKSINQIESEIELCKGIQISGWIKVHNILRVHLCQQFGLSAYGLYTTILSHYNTKTGQCFVSTRVLSKETGACAKTINNLINTLYNAGYLIVNSGSNNKANNYWFPHEPFFNPEDSEMLSSAKRKGNMKKENMEGLETQVEKQVRETLEHYDMIMQADDIL